MGGDIPDAAAGQVIGDLGDDHIGLINGDPVSGSQLQPLHDTEVVDTGPAYGGPLQLHWLEYGHRIDKSRPGGAPFNIGEGGLLELVRPLKGNGVSGEFGGAAQGCAVGDIVIEKHQAVGGDVVVPDPAAEIFYCRLQGLRGHLHKLHSLKAHGSQP